MSQPRRFTSNDGDTEAVPGRAIKTRAHPQVGLFVTVSEEFDPGEDTFELTIEVSPDDETYAEVDNPELDEGDIFKTTQEDVSETDTGEYTVYYSYHNVPIEFVRTNIRDHSGGFEITTDLYLSGWTQRGASFDYLVTGDSK